MKRILSSCLLLLLTLSFKQVSAQAFNFSINPTYICFNPAGTNTAQAAVTATQPGAGSYSWTIISPTCGAASSVIAVPNGSVMNVTFPCCGDYVITCYAFAAINPTQVIGSSVQYTAFVVCPNAASITTSAANNNTVCANTPLNLIGNGAVSYTWTSAPSGGGTTTPNTNPLVVNPSVNTTYTLLGVTHPSVGSCPITTTMSLYVQSASIAAGPATQSICASSPICLTTTVGVITGTANTPGTVTSSIQWYEPGGNAVSGCTTAAVFGTYTAVLTYTGQAGSCTVAATAQVFTTSTIPVTLTASSMSVCPGGNVTLTAVSAQTSAVSNHTWTQNFGGPIAGNGNPIVRAPTTFPRCYTVDVNYFGCPGSANICIGLLTLTPTLTPSSFSVCPNRSLTLTASGGVTYTFTAIPSVGANTVLTKPTPSTATHIPGTAAFPMQYAVSAASTGCTGSTTITVNIRTITPIVTASSNSVCPNTTFTLNASGGAGTNYTFTAPPSTSLATGAVNTHTYNAVGLPSTYTIGVDSAGCNGTSTITIGLLTLTPTVALSSPSICAGTAFCFTSTGGSQTQYTFYAPPGTVVATPDPTVNTACHIPIFNPTTTPTYTVLVDSVGCTGSATFSVGILNLGPQINLSALTAVDQSSTACPNSVINLTTSGFSNPSNYTFTFTIPGTPPASTIATAGTSTLGAIAPGSPTLFPATYTVAVDSAGCVGTKTVNVSLRNLNITVSASSASVCAGTNVTITAAPGHSNTLYSFVSFVPPFTTTSTPSSPLTNFVFQPIVPTVYSVLADSAGCTNQPPAPTSTVLVGMNPGLVIGASASPSIICSGLPSTLSVAGSTAYTYTWTAPSGSGGTLQIGTGTTSNVNPTITTIYTVSALDAGGCVGSQTVALVVDPTASLSMNITAPFNTVCPTQHDTLTASGAVNYTWVPATFLSSMNSSVTISTPSTSIIYTVNGNNGLGCNGSSTFTITVNSMPHPTIVPSTTAVCVGFSSTLTAFGAQSYTWTGTTFTGSIAQQSISVVPGIFCVTGSNGGSCINDTCITINPAPNLTITPTATSNHTTCITNNSPKLAKPIILNASGAATYAWFPYDPTTMTYSLGPQTTVRPHSSTCYTVTGGTSVCSGSAIICVTVVPQFTINVTPPLPAICLGDSMKLSVVNIGAGAIGSPAAFTYSWTEAQNAPPISISNNLTPTVMAFPMNTTTYSVDVADTRSCVSLPRLITVTVLPRPITAVSLPIINNVATNTVCFVGASPGAPDNVITLTANNMNAGLQFGIVPTFTWTSPYNPSSILTPPNNNVVTVSAPTRTPPVVIYTVTSGYNGIQGCKRVDTVSIRVIDCRPITQVTFTTATLNDTICSRGCVTFLNLTDTTAGGPQKLVWKFPGGAPATSTLANPTICYNLPGKYNVILEVSNPYPIANGGSSGVKGVLSFVNVVDIPNVTIEPPGQLHSDRYIRFGESTDLSGSGALSYLWDPPYNITSLTKPNVTVSPIKTTQYVLWGYNSKDCLSSDTINVIVVQDCGEMFVPNAFSPNNDGHNDIIQVQGICLETMTFMIFNRWGEKVFESTNQKIGWDGTYKGHDMETGVYVYRLEGKTYDGKGFSAKGNVTLIR